MTDLEGLKALGAAPGEVSKLISECFNEMIFAFGDVHCGEGRQGCGRCRQMRADRVLLRGTIGPCTGIHVAVMALSRLFALHTS